MAKISQLAGKYIPAGHGSHWIGESQLTLFLTRRPDQPLQKRASRRPSNPAATANGTAYVDAHNMAESQTSLESTAHTLQEEVTIQDSIAARHIRHGIEAVDGAAVLPRTATALSC